MNTPPPRAGHLPSPQDTARIDQLCDEFEDAWKVGQTPRIEDYLGRVEPALRQPLIQELVALESAYRRRRGDTVPVDYRIRFPGVKFFNSLNHSDSITLSVDSANNTEFSVGDGTLPTRLGDYERLEEIARGGMGIVYRARDPALNREVAVKLLQHRFPADGVVARRFVDEARITGQLQHPGIPAIHQVGKLSDGRPFLAMKLVKGRTLEDLLGEDSAGMSSQPVVGLKREPAAVRDRYIAIFEQICQAVGYAHARHVIHRDLKPANVMVGAFGEVQVMDWGLAKILNEDNGPRERLSPEPTEMATVIRSGRESDSETQAGSVLGTPSFMSPEQAGGELEKLGPPSDVFGLGAILCVILTGHPPYRGPDAEAIRLLAVRGKLDDAFAALDASGAAPALIALAKHCMTVEPADRPAHAGIVAEAVAHLRAAAVERARQSELEEARAAVRDAERRKRRRVWRGFAAASLILLFAIAAASTIAAGVFRKQRDDIEAAQRDERKANREAQKRLARSLLNEARGNRLSRRLGQRFETLKLIDQASRLARGLELQKEFFDDLRNEAIATFANPDLQVVKQGECVGDGVPSVAYEPSFTHFACWDSKGRIDIQKVHDYAPLCRLPGDGYNANIWLSRGGQFLAAFDATMRFQIWKVDHSPATVQLELSKPAAVGCFSFSAEGQRAAIGSDDRSIVIYDLASTKEVRRISVDIDAIYLAFHPTLNYIAVMGSHSVQIINLDVGSPIADLPHSSTINYVSWHPAGTHLAVVTRDDMRVSIWNLANKEVVKVLEGLPDGTTATFSPTGELLATAGWDHVTRLWHWPTGQLLVSTENPVGLVLFGDDGRFLGPYVSGKNVGYWEVNAAPEHRLLVREAALGRGYYGEAAVSPDGRVLFAAMKGGVNIWDLASGRELGFLPGAGSTGVAVAHNGSVVTALGGAVQRWPISDDQETPHHRRLGPPKRLPLGFNAEQCDVSHDGKVLIAGQNDGAVVLHVERPNQPIRLQPHRDCRYVAISPDGRWVATGSHFYSSVKVWNATTGKLEKELLSDQTSIRVQFSPDGRWLLTNQVNAHATRLWRVESWLEGPVIGNGGFGSTASPDGRCIAVGTSHGTVRLFDSVAERELAQLEEFLQDRAEYCRFSPDGSQLVAVSGVGRRIHVWDLRLIRKQLKAMDLDWELPPLKTAMPPFAKSLQLEIKLGSLPHVPIFKLVNENKFREAVEAVDQRIKKAPKDEELFYLRGLARAGLKNYESAIDDYGQALKLNAEHIGAHHYRGHAMQALNRHREALADFTEASKREPTDSHLHDMRARMLGALKDYAESVTAWERSLEVLPEQSVAREQLAWLYVLGPMQYRDAKKALPLAERAVELGKDAPQYLNTLGIVYFRLDRLEEAVKSLEKAADEFKNQQSASNRFVLSMCYHRQGNAAKAKQLFDEGVSRSKLQVNLTPDRREQLDAVQAEAEKLLNGK